MSVEQSAQRNSWVTDMCSLVFVSLPDRTHCVGGCNLSYRIVAAWRLQLEKRFERVLAFIKRQFIEGGATSYLIFKGLS